MTPIQVDTIRDAQHRALSIPALFEQGGVIACADLEWLRHVTGTTNRDESFERIREQAEHRDGLFAPLPCGEVQRDVTGGGPSRSGEGDIPRLLARLAAACHLANERGIECGMDLRAAYVEVYHRSGDCRLPGRVWLAAPDAAKGIEDQIERLENL